MWSSGGSSSSTCKSTWNTSVAPFVPAATQRQSTSSAGVRASSAEPFVAEDSLAAQNKRLTEENRRVQEENQRLLAQLEAAKRGEPPPPPAPPPPPPGPPPLEQGPEVVLLQNLLTDDASRQRAPDAGQVLSTQPLLVPLEVPMEVPMDVPPLICLDDVERNHVVWGGFDKSTSSEPSSSVASGASCQQRGADARLVTASANGMVHLVETQSSTSTSNSSSQAPHFAEHAQFMEYEEYEDHVPQEGERILTGDPMIDQPWRYYEDGKKKPRSRPCKGQRLRHRKQVAKVLDQVNDNPEQFDLESAELPTAMHKSERVKKKMMDRLTSHKANLLREMTSRRLEGAVESGTVPDVSGHDIGRRLPTYPNLTGRGQNQQKKSAITPESNLAFSEEQNAGREDTKMSL